MSTLKHWIFDLDDTLHHAGHLVFPLISLRMTQYIMHHLQTDEEEAHRLRTAYWQRYGATLGGLIKHHRVNPAHFLAHTHQMNEILPLIDGRNHIAQILQKLPGRKWVFSNGPQHYVDAIISHLRIGHLFEEAFGIERFGAPKPHAAAYHQVMRRAGIQTRQCIMVEDSLANLQTACQLGMKTVWISPRIRKPQWLDWRISQLHQLSTLPLNGPSGGA